MFGIFGMHIVHAFVSVLCVFACFPCVVPVFHVYHACFCMFFPCVVHILVSSQCLVCFGMHLVPVFVLVFFLCSIFSSFSGVGHTSSAYFSMFFLCVAH